MSDNFLNNMQLRPSHHNMQNTAYGLASGISHNLITRVELPMRPGYNARGKQKSDGYTTD
jgi:hypothetical protein